MYSGELVSIVSTILVVILLSVYIAISKEDSEGRKSTSILILVIAIIHVFVGVLNMPGFARIGSYMSGPAVHSMASIVLWRETHVGCLQASVGIILFYLCYMCWPVRLSAIQAGET